MRIKKGWTFFWVGLAGLGLILVGCGGDEAAEKSKPQVVSKKIVTAKPKNAKPAKPKKTPKKPAKKKTVAAKKKATEKTKTQATAKTAEQKTVVVTTPAAEKSGTVVNIATSGEASVEATPGVSPADQKDIEEKRNKSTLAAISPTSEIQAARKILLPDLSKPYDPRGKVDPFRPLFRDKAVSIKMQQKKERRKKRIPLTPLERIDLGQLKLVGVIQAKSGNKALVEEASGKGYILTRGTYVGLNAGQVIQILKDRVVVEEEVENIQGDLVIQNRELRLKRPSGEL